LPVLTEVDGSMIPLEELDDSTKGLEGWHGAGLLWNCSIPITNTKGSYLYPCPNMTPDQLRVQHLIPKLMLRCQCLSYTRHQFVPSFYLGHVITYSRKLHFKNANSPFAERWHIADRKHLYRILWGDFPCRMVFSLPNSAHKSVPFLYKFLVLTYAPSTTG
jgi:hypothetical protein